MNIKPRKVEPGYMKRWFKQSVAMMIYSPLNWILVLSCFYLLDGYNINTVAKILMGMFFVVLGLEFSHYAYERKNSLDVFVRSLVNTFKSFFMQIKLRLVVLIFVLGAIALLNYAQDAALAKMTAEELAKIEKRVPRFMGDSVWFFIFGVTFLNMGGMMRIFSHLLNRYFGVEERAIIDVQCHNAAMENKDVNVTNEVALFGLIFVLGILFPTLIFIIYPVYCGMVYLAFREIFVGDNEVKVEEDVKEESFIAKPALIDNR